MRSRSPLDERAFAHRDPVTEGIVGKHLVLEHARVIVGGGSLRSKPERGHIIEKRRRLDHGLGFQRKRRQPRPCGGQADQVAKRRARGSNVIALLVDGDAFGPRRFELGHERSRIEHVAALPFGPLAFDEAEDLHVVQIREPRRLRVEDPDAAPSRRDFERLRANPAANGR